MNTQSWTSQIDQNTSDFKAAFAQLSADQLNWKPNPDTWSIGQNIDHLIVINKTYFPVIAEVRAGTYKASWVAKIGFLVKFLGNMILKSVQPTTTRKIKTFPIWEPAKSNIPADILQKFEAHQQELKALISNSADLLDKGTVISSPANANIVYKLDRAFDIIVTHEQRHLQQAKQVMAQLRENVG